MFDEMDDLFEGRVFADPFDEESTVDTISEWQIAAGTPGAVQI